MLLKGKIIETVRTIQLDAINDLRAEIEDAQNSANEYGTPRDRYDSYRAQLLRKRDMFAQQLFKAREQLDVLNKMDLDKEFDKVEFGALVITSQQKIFVSIGLGKFMCENVAYYAISPIVPIYNALKDKRPGNIVDFRGSQIEIIEIF